MTELCEVVITARPGLAQGPEPEAGRATAVRQRAQLRSRPVQVSGISTRTIADGNPDYLMWISQEAAPD